MSRTALAPEVVHVRVGADPVSPWIGQPPLRRASLTATMLHALESALAEVFECAPLGSQVLPFPEAAGTDMESLSRGFRGRRGSVLLHESVVVSAAGGPTPATDWRPSSTSPDLSKSLTTESLAAARESIAMAFGVLPCLLNPATTGPAIREAQRHLAAWQLDPLARLLAQESSEKLGERVTIDVLRPLQAFDSGGRARALATVIDALARAQESGIDPSRLAKALTLTGWEDETR